MLDRLQPRRGAKHAPKRVGRGPGSGLNKTSGRGMKGQGKRSAGRATPLKFEGGQMPLVQRLPKRGFYSRNRTTYQIVNLAALAVFEDGATIDREALVSRGLVNGKGAPVKLLGEGDAPKNLKVSVAKISAGARKKIESAGGTAEIV
ncbi:MAG: 50S ribosomal protein L15 [Dehalococcoidia bacterium]